jgi:hypothetical protein
MIKGNVLSWNDAKFSLVNMTESYVPISSICIPPRPGHVIMPELRDFYSLIDICHKFKGQPSVVQTNEEQSFMNDVRRKTTACNSQCKILGGMLQVIKP